MTPGTLLLTRNTAAVTPCHSRSKPSEPAYLPRWPERPRHSATSMSGLREYPADLFVRTELAVTPQEACYGAARTTTGRRFHYRRQPGGTSDAGFDSATCPL